MNLTKYQRELQAMSRFLKCMREVVDDAITVQKLDTLLTVALRPDGIEQQNLMMAAKLSRSGTSKNVTDLTKLTSKHEQGPDLVESLIDPMNRVGRTVKLTRRGESQLLKSLVASFGEKK
jgi:DNA-binding MarR family transcriptional regulator